MRRAVRPAAATAGSGVSGPQASSDPGAYLVTLGERVRAIRTRRGMSRKVLARDSAVSERYLAQLESGRGNITILLLRQLASALDTPLEVLVMEDADAPLDLTRSVALLNALSIEELADAHGLLTKRFGGDRAAHRNDRIALIGLRGAGKSTIGRDLAERMHAPFVELDREIERESGMPLAAIFDLYGQPAYRRLERRCLERTLETHGRAVVETGGGLVSDAATFEKLLATCFTVWVRATPSEHMSRVLAQGDTRPMSNNREAMADLKRILRSREALYRRADIELDTSNRTPEESVNALLDLLPSAAGA